MRIGIFGFGSMGKRHAANAQALGHEVQVFDPAYTFPQPFRMHFHEDDLLAWHPDAVVIASPAQYHADQFWRVIKANPATHVLVEKPLAQNVLAWTRSRNGVVPTGTHMVGYNLRFHRGLEWVQKNLPRVGRVYFGKFWVRCDRALWPGRTYTSTLLECSHEIDLALWLLGSATVPACTHLGEDEWRVILHHGYGCHSLVEIDGRFQGYDRGGEIIGVFGRISWRWHAPSGSFEADGSGLGWKDGVSMIVRPEETYSREMGDFLDQIDNPLHGMRLRPTIDDGLAVLEVTDRAQL